MAVDADSPDGELNESTTARSRAEPTSADRSASESPEAPVGAGADISVEDAESDVADYDGEIDEVGATRKRARFAVSPARLGLVVVLALAGLVGWLGFRAYESHQAEDRRELFLAVGRHGALNLTAVDWQRADADIQRILSSATGAFYDDFSTRSQAFVEFAKRTQLKSVGTISEAGLESVSGDGAQVLVAVSVKTSNIGAAEQEPRSWRMRMSVQKVGDDAKVSNVAFVP